MAYTSVSYYIIVVGVLIIYYILPKRFRWLALLAGSAAFYYKAFEHDFKGLIVFAASIAVSYLAGLLLQKLKTSEKRALKRVVLFLGIFLSASPLIVSKVGDFICSGILYRDSLSWIVPIGLSFYTLQMVAYLVDIYKGKIDAQKNPLKYTLFISFFPQLIQGPIPRYEQLGHQLFEGHQLKLDNLVGGFELLLWGFFLKTLIADRAAIIVNTIFNSHEAYSGIYILLAGVLYSLQLYTDFLSCTKMAQGVSRLFGIRIIDNFQRPYYSSSIKDFWRRWHMSLSFWLRDYIYIPLGGNRHGRVLKWLFLLITFAVSGLWHGGGWKFLVWGLLHAVFQIIGEIVHLIRKKIHEQPFKLEKTGAFGFIRRLWTFFLVMLAWIIFRADTLETALQMIKNMFTVFNPWRLFDDTLLDLGLSGKEWILLLVALLILWFISSRQEKGIGIRKWISARSLPVRWTIMIAALVAIWVFGIYGFGFDAGEFIYGGF